jgi:hypothetical protein
MLAMSNSSGVLDYAIRLQLAGQNHPSCDALEQKFENLDVPPGF